MQMRVQQKVKSVGDMFRDLRGCESHLQSIFCLNRVSQESGEGQGWTIFKGNSVFMNPALCSSGDWMLTTVLFPESYDIFVPCPGAGSRGETVTVCF